jgi:AcrR family transcriptional regulator
MRKLKQKILKTASELFSEFGFLGVSMGDIAKKLGITKAALYYHFKSKKEIYFRVLNESFERLKKKITKKISVAKSKEETLAKIIEGYLEFCLKEKNLIRFLHLKLSKKDSEMKTYLENLKKQINLFFQEKLKKISKEPDFVHYLFGALDGIIMKVKKFPKKLNLKKVASQITRVYLLLLKSEKNYV